MEQLLPLIIFGTVFSCVGIIIGLDKLHEKRSSFKRKLRDMNTLYRCDSCHRYFRKYFIDLKKNYDPAYANKRNAFEQDVCMPISYYSQFCPHCEDGIGSECRTAEKWVNKHPDAPLLTIKNFHTFEKIKEEVSMLIYENTVNLTEKDRDIDLLCSEMLLKISSQDKKEKSWY